MFEGLVEAWVINLGSLLILVWTGGRSHVLGPTALMDSPNLPRPSGSGSGVQAHTGTSPRTGDVKDDLSQTPRFCPTHGRYRDQTSIHQLGGLPSALDSPSQLHLSGRAARTCAAIAGDTPASLTTQRPYPRITGGEPQEQFRDASSIAGRNFTSARQPIIPMSDGSLGPAPRLMTILSWRQLT